jgi:predicted nucleotidyltransferase
VRGLTKTDILRGLHELAAELGPASPPRELTIAGGAALVLLYDARQSTKDVDLVISAPGVRDAARAVALKLGWPEDWLNDGAKGFMHGSSRGDVVLESPGLVVRSLSPPHLLAMKLCAWRDDVDVEDARLLLSKLEGDKNAIWNRLETHLVTGRELKARYAFDDLWEAARGRS